MAKVGLLFSALILSSLSPALTGAGPAAAQEADATMAFKPCKVQGVQGEVLCGTYNVFENRQARQGRTLPIRVIVLRAAKRTSGTQPVFFMAGGPGQTASHLADWMSDSPIRSEHDIVMVDQRGTGEGHRLDCRVSGSADDPQSYLEPIFQPALFSACRAKLEQTADLTQYTTVAFVDDVDEIRQAMGYDKITLMGGSYGTIAALEYIRKHGQHVRSAMLTSPAPPEWRNPLHHARAAQDALDGLVAKCQAETACRDTFPTFRQDFQTIMERLRASPAKVHLPAQEGRKDADVLLGARSFAEAVRVILYSPESASALPLLVSRAMKGEFRPFAEAGLASNQALRNSLSLGLLQSVACNEDIPRIRPEEIGPVTVNTFLGADRIEQQTAACAEWPRVKVEPYSKKGTHYPVPALLITGDLDPVTPSYWGDRMATYLPNSLHLTVPGGHSPTNACLHQIGAQFIRTAKAQGLDRTCVAKLQRPKFVLRPE